MSSLKERFPPRELLQGLPSEQTSQSLPSDSGFGRSPYANRRGINAYPDLDLSFNSSGRPSTDRMYPSFESFDTSSTPRFSSFSNFSDLDNQGFETYQYGRRSVDTMTPTELSFVSAEGDINLPSSPPPDDLDAEMRRLKLELKQTMDMYNTACKEALSAKQKAMELQHWKMEEEQRLEEARLAEEKALALAEREKAKSKAAIEHASRWCSGLPKALGANSDLLRHEVTYVLGQLQNKSAIDALSSVLKAVHEHPMVRHEAAEALGSIADGQCIALLEEFVKDPEPIVSQSCEIALSMLEFEKAGKAFEKRMLVAA